MDIEKLKKLMHLKVVYRTGDFDNRKESTAEHVYGCLILAQHFIKEIKEELDELKVMKLILYHDIVEIEVGDADLKDLKKRKNKKEKEKQGAKILANNIPTTISKEFLDHFEEFEELKTREAKFAKAIDYIEPMIHWALFEPDWKKWGYTEKFQREQKEHFMAEFPELLDFFNDMLKYAKGNNYF